MSKETKLDKSLLLVVTLLFTISSLFASYFSYEVYQNKKTSSQPQSKDLLVMQPKLDSEGKVLGGGYNPDYAFTIENNSLSPSSRTLVKSTGPYTMYLLNLDLSERTVVADDASWSVTMSASEDTCGPDENERCVMVDSKWFDNPGTYKFHLQSNTNAKGTFYARTSSGDSSPPSDTPSETPSTPSSPSTDSSSSTGTTTQTTTSEKETLNDVALPKIFTAKDSQTTNLAKISNLKKVSNFTLDVPGKNKIVFSDTLDLSSEKLVNQFRNLHKYVKIETVGKVEVDSKSIPALNKKAAITMSNLKFVTEPEVLVDGKKDTKKVISNLNYGKKKGTLTFDTAHFTSLWAAPKLELTDPATSNLTKQQDYIKGTISDPTAVITGRLNEVDLASYTPDEKTGEFTIENVNFQEGENALTLEAESVLHKILPLVTTITYSPTNAALTASEQSNKHYVLLIVSLISALIFLILVGYLVYRKRKYFAKADAAAQVQVFHR